MIYMILWLVGCLIAGWMGRKRRLGFWGNLIVALFVSPLLVIVILILTHPDPKVGAPAGE